MVSMKQRASNQFNQSKLTGGIALSVTLSAPLSGVITSRPPFYKENYYGTERNHTKHIHG